MAKKNLASLIDGIVGDRSNMTSEDLTNDINEKTTEKRKVGRPRRDSDPGAETEVRASFIVNEMQLKKLKYISLMESKMQKEVLFDALKDYIDTWEDLNGEINIPRKK